MTLVTTGDDKCQPINFVSAVVSRGSHKRKTLVFRSVPVGVNVSPHSGPVTLNYPSQVNISSKSSKG